MIKLIINLAALLILYALSEILKPKSPSPDLLTKFLYYLPYSAVMVLIFILTNTTIIPSHEGNGTTQPTPTPIAVAGSRSSQDPTSAPQSSSVVTDTPAPTDTPTPVPTATNTPTPVPTATSAPAPVSEVRTFEADSDEEYLEHFPFTDRETGSCNIYNMKWVQFLVAWKTAEWDDQDSDIDLEIRVRRANGELVDTYRFTPSQDDTGKDEDGYYYVGSKWFDLFPDQEYHDGEQFKVEYEAFTSDGQRVTGDLRSGDIHVWVKPGSKS